MEKPLLKITFKEPQKVFYDGIYSMANFLLISNPIYGNDRFFYYETKDGIGFFVYIAKIKSIEFIQPNEI